jgi:formylglycine-generating enzyme required for sulfatase activity
MPETERGTQHFKPKAETPKVGKNYLLAIGINDYVHETKLRFAVRDAEEVTKLLQTHYQFEPENCVLLRDQQATQDGILDALAELAPRLEEADSLLVYFAGHGHLDKRTRLGYWVPIEGKSNGVRIINQEVVALINHMPCRHVLLVSDSCFSGTFFLERPKVRGMAEEALALIRSRWGLASGRAEPVLDNSLFAQFFRQVLTDNQEKMLGISQVIVDVRKLTAEATKNAQVPTSGVLEEHAGGEFVFYRRPAPPDLAQLQAENQELRTKVDDLEAQLAQARRSPAPDAGVLTRLQKELRELQNQIDDLNEEIAAAAAKVKVLEEETKTQKATIKTQATEVQQLKTDLAKEQTQTKQLVDTLTQAEAELNETKAQVTQLTTNLAQAEAKLNETKVQLTQLTTDLADYHQAEQVVFDAFMPERRPAALDQYLALFPKGRFADQARQLREELMGRNYTETINGVSFNMIYIEGGEFRMGDTFGDSGDNSNELPVHQVTLDGYYLGETVVTQGLYRAVVGSNPSKFKLSDEHPVEMVSWEDAQAFIQKLNQLTGKKYGLPTEAQWEFAARERGRQVRFGNGKDILRPSEANFDASKDGKQPYSEVGEYRQKTTPVKTFAPNALGLYDMAGNVLEWCQDGYDEKFYDTSAARARNPVNLKEGAHRVFRGGYWGSRAYGCRAADRFRSVARARPDPLGFRLASV